MYGCYVTLLLLIIIIINKTRADNLQVKIKSINSSFFETKDIHIKLMYKNKGNENIFIYKWYLSDGDLWDPLFIVFCNNTLIEYIGPSVKRLIQGIRDTIVLAPGDTRTAIVRLSSAYDMKKGGSCSIKFKMSYEDVIFRSWQKPRMISWISHTEALPDIESNDIRLSIARRSNVHYDASINKISQTRASTISYFSCSSLRRLILHVAVDRAMRYSRSSLDYLRYTKLSDKPRYKMWFGSFAWGRWNTVREQFKSILAAFHSKFLSFDCTCNKRDIYAYVFTKKPYKIYLCGAFWETAMTGADSKAGTLIHEMSHFAVLAGTDDYAFGPKACKTLANRNPSRAIQNADSHEYFAENTSSLT